MKNRKEKIFAYVGVLAGFVSLFVGIMAEYYLFLGHYGFWYERGYIFLAGLFASIFGPRVVYAGLQKLLSETRYKDWPADLRRWFRRDHENIYALVMAVFGILFILLGWRDVAFFWTKLPQSVDGLTKFCLYATSGIIVALGGALVIAVIYIWKESRRKRY